MAQPTDLSTNLLPRKDVDSVESDSIAPRREIPNVLTQSMEVPKRSILKTKQSLPPNQ